MIQTHTNLKKGEIKLKPENKDDLWILSQIIDSEDLIKSRTLRKIKVGGKDERSGSVARKPMFLSLKVEKVELAENLRILGTVTEGNEDVPKGSHHSFNIEENDILTIIKPKWLKFQLDKVKEATKTKVSPILICVLDRDECYIALMKRRGFEVIAHLEGNVQKKDVEVKSVNFYEEIIKKLEEIVGRQRIDNIILASPAFWKEDLMKKISKDEIKKKIHLATCSAVGKSAINEVLKRKEIQNVMKEDRTTQEINLVEHLFEEISKDEKAAYGTKEVNAASDSGAIEILLVTDGLIKKSREDNNYQELEKLMKNVDSIKGEVHLISSDNDGGKQLDGLGGIGAILRFKMNY
ncbi:mRNA surveillance protein pelota [Nanoarchaeota archaeon]